MVVALNINIITIAENIWEESFIASRVNNYCVGRMKRRTLEIMKPPTFLDIDPDIVIMGGVG